MRFRTLKLKEVAELFDVSPRWIDRLSKEKDFPRVARGQYDLKKCVRWYLGYLRAQVDEARRGTDSIQRSEERKAKAQADLLELKLARERAQVITVDEAIATFEPMLAAIRSLMMGIPKHAARELANKEIEQYLDTFIRRALTEISEMPTRLYRLDKIPVTREADKQPAPRKRARRPAEMVEQ